MKCNECASLLEDLLYSNFGTTQKDLAEHLTVCDACAREYALLRKEKELYDRCDLEVAPNFWAGVQARIAGENGLHAQRFVGLFDGVRFAHMGAAFTGLIIVVGSIGLWRYLETRPGPAEFPNAPQVSVATTEQKSDAVAVTVSSKTEGSLIDKRDVSKHPLVSKPFNLKGASRAYARKIEKPLFSTDTVVERNQIFTSQRRDLDADSARHLEQVEILLRSFKNSRFLRDSNTLDLTYESRLSKDLLVRNALLRRDAELAGDVPLTRLLDQFEPFLVDIANLRDNSDSKEIRQVRESLTKAQIIAALHSF